MFLLMFFINWIAYKTPSVIFGINSKKCLLGSSWLELENLGIVKPIDGYEGYYWHENI